MHVYLHTCASTCTQKEAAPRERTGAKLSPDHRARLLGWMGVAGTLCFVPPCFSFKSLQGNAIIRNTKGRKCRRSTTHPRGSVKDKTSKWSREKGEREREPEKEQAGPRNPPMCPDGPGPLGLEQVSRMLISPLKNCVVTEKTLRGWARQASFMNQSVRCYQQVAATGKSLGPAVLSSELHSRLPNLLAV